jgi:RNA polymerase sigma factor (sigma-70 family)
MAWMNTINYYGQQISVSDEVAEFLEQDRLRQAAQQRSDKRHIDFVDIDFACSANLLDDTPPDPTFEQAFINLQLRDLRTAYQSLSDDDRKLLCLYYYHELSMEEIGKTYSVTKMAISKRLRKLHDRLRSLIEK